MDKLPPTTCDECGFDLVVFNDYEPLDKQKYTHHPETPLHLLDHQPSPDIDWEAVL